MKATPTLWQAVADVVGAIVAKQCELLSAALRYMTEMTFSDGSPPATPRAVAERVRQSGAEAFTAAKDRVVAQVAEWLSDPAGSAGRADLVARLLPHVLTAVDESGLRSFIGGRVRAQLDSVQITPLAAGLVSTAIEKGQHQRLLDELLDALEKLLSNEAAMETLRQTVRARMPALFDLYRGEPYVLNKIVASATSLLVEVRTDPDHPLRVQLDEYVTTFADRLRTSPDLAERVD
ncbi:MAG: DUF445 family protein, partial [Burkholderiales bacterium]